MLVNGILFFISAAAVLCGFHFLYFWWRILCFLVAYLGFALWLLSTETLAGSIGSLIVLTSWPAYLFLVRRGERSRQDLTHHAKRY